MRTKTRIAAVLIALVLMAGLGSAMLVGYISNTVVRDVEVESPLDISEDLVVLDMHGGDIQCLTLDVTNNANRNVCGYVQVTVSVNGGEFDGDGMLINGDMLHQGTGTSCGCIPGDYYDSMYEWPCVCFETGLTEQFDAEIVTAPNLEPGTYTFSTVVVPCDCDWTDWDCTCVEGEDNCCEHDSCTGGCLCGDW